MELYASPVDSLLSPDTRRRGSPSYDKFAWQPGGLLTRVIGYTTIHIYIGESQGDGRGARVNIRKCHWSMEARTSAMLRDAKMKFEMDQSFRKSLWNERDSILCTRFFLLGIELLGTFYSTFTTLASFWSLFNIFNKQQGQNDACEHCKRQVVTYPLWNVCLFHILNLGRDCYKRGEDCRNINIEKIPCFVSHFNPFRSWLLAL